MKTLAALCIAALFVAFTLMSVGAAVALDDNSVYQPNYTRMFTRTPSGFRESCGPQRSARCVPVRFSAREE